MIHQKQITSFMDDSIVNNSFINDDAMNDVILESPLTFHINIFIFSILLTDIICFSFVASVRRDIFYNASHIIRNKISINKTIINCKFYHKYKVY